VTHTDSLALPLGNQVLGVNIGTEIIDPAHQGPRPGFIYTPAGNRYDWEIYDGKPDDPAEFKTQQIIPVNEGALEVWWANVNQSVQWPSFVKRYQAGWAPSTEKIIIASQQGSGPIDAATQKDFRLYVQNDPTLAGFNPNDEQALIHDGGS